MQHLYDKFIISDLNLKFYKYIFFLRVKGALNYFTLNK